MLDLGGFITSPEFLSQIASIIVAILSTLFSVFLEGFLS
jgi:hypothetical protein